MRGDAGIFGRLTLAANKREAWLASELDWKAVEGSSALKGYIGGETVADIVEDVGFIETAEFLELRWEGDELQLRSFQSDAGFRESVVGFAAAWAASAKHGGSGFLVGLGMVGTAFGYRLEVDGGQAKLIEYPDDRLAELAAEPDAVALRARMAELGGAFATKLEAPPPVPRPKRVVLAEEPPKAKKPAAKKPAAKKPAAKKPAAKKR